MTPTAPFKLSDQCLTQLALAVAMDIAPLPDICGQHGITEQYFKNTVAVNPFFKRVLEQYVIEWNSVKNTPERVKWKAQALTELALPTLGARMLDGKETLPAVTEAAKLVSRLGSLDNDKGNPGAAGEKFTITINLGPDNSLTLEKDAEASSGSSLHAIPQGPTETPAIPQIAGPEGSPTPVRDVPEGTGG